MKNFKEIAVPELISKYCKTDKRGLPVPFVVYVDDQNEPHFKINDTHKDMHCLMNNLCSICGQDLHEDKWLLGGPASAFDAQGAFIDIPVHHDCGVYAFKVCPYLAMSSYTSKSDMVKMAKAYPDLKLFNPTLDSERVPFFVFGKIEGLMMGPLKDTIAFKSAGPYLEVEYWGDGEQITDVAIITARLTGTKWEKYLGIALTYCNFNQHEQRNIQEKMGQVSTDFKN